jgi:hypothetical protein
MLQRSLIINLNKKKYKKHTIKIYMLEYFGIYILGGIIMLIYYIIVFHLLKALSWKGQSDFIGIGIYIGLLVGLHAVNYFYLLVIHPKLFGNQITSRAANFHSLIGFGSGQAYNGQWIKGIFFLVCITTPIHVYMYLVAMNGREQLEGTFWIGFLSLVFLVLSIFDARYVARKKSNEKSVLHSVVKGVKSLSE